jgi:hypothetical protein
VRFGGAALDKAGASRRLPQHAEEPPHAEGLSVDGNLPVTILLQCNALLLNDIKYKST